MSMETVRILTEELNRLRADLAEAERQRDEADAALVAWEDYSSQTGYSHSIEQRHDMALAAARTRQAAKEPK